MESMPISKFRTVCVAVLERVHRTGQPVRITRSGEPLAEIVPVSPLKPRNWLGSFRSSGTIVGDIVSPTLDATVFGEWSSPEDEDAFRDL
jgi:prevent-host-death family protein